ncbi:MAG: GNAT family N-acetyltransferase [Phycisphaerales bacterium]|nr:MAG: GNAT family N-acetyltransferase [Phycisphaerales bacterium]
MDQRDSFPDLHIRPVSESDVPLLLTLIKELAKYERLADKVEATEVVLRESLLGAQPAAEALIAYLGAEPVGYAIWFYNFSSFTGRPGLYIEDVYVRRHARSRGVGKALLLHLVRLAKERSCARMEWAVLDWNEPAISFYRGLGARPMDEWTIFRLDADDLSHLAENLP